MKTLTLLFLLLAPAARAEFRPFNTQAAEVPELNFCAPGKLLIFTGSCSPGGKLKDVISPKACGGAAAMLGEGLKMLYPNVSVETYEDLSADGVLERLMRPLVLGFFFIGEGDTKGGFITGPARERIYPDAGACQSAYDLFGGFTSHSKYSPSSAAPKTDRGLVLSRTQVLYDAAGAAQDSWPKLCKPRISVIYPTRTFAGRMKDDAKKFINLLQDEKKKHVLKTLGTICDNCQGHLAAGDALAQLCPPNSNVCKLRKIVPGSEKFVLENYCGALAPAASR